MTREALQSLVSVAIVILFAAFLVDASICRLIADRHRRRVPDDAWKTAGVDRLFWGFLGVNIYVPFSDIYYLARIRGRLDQAARERPLG